MTAGAATVFEANMNCLQRSLSAHILNRELLLHLRFPFSLFLLPIYLFAISQAPVFYWREAILVGIILHVLIYPASNAYNSCMDQDEGSIGGLKDPPQASRQVYYASIVFDTAGLVLSFLCGFQLFLLLIPYIAASKAYSWHGIRLKKYPITGWLTVALFQGGYTYMLVHMTVSRTFGLAWLELPNITCMVVSTLLIGGLYPLTQIYQIDEDRQRNDVTMSSLLGQTGTFLFVILLMTAATVLLGWHFHQHFILLHFWIFLATLSPVACYLLYWMMRVKHDSHHANFQNTMVMNTLAAGSMIICFGIIGWLNHG